MTGGRRENQRPLNLHFGLGDVQARGLGSLLNPSPDRIGEAEVSAVLRRGPAGMRILIGPQPGEDYEELDPVQVGRLLQVLRLMTEYLVLDLPSQPTAATQAAVGLCDFVGVVTEREAGAIRAAIEHRDDRRLKQAVHKLKGSAGVFKDVPAAQKAAQQMECVGADADWDQVENAWSNLAAEMDRLMTTLQKASSSPIPVEE